MWVQLPSFSRTGKYCSNKESSSTLHTVRNQSPSEASETRIKFKSLAETPPVLVGYNSDHGRLCSISSSPRVDESHAEKQLPGKEIRYQRVIRWDDTLIMSKVKPAEGKALHTNIEPGAYQCRSRFPEARTTSASFRSCERGRDQCAVRKQKASVAPPPGHYDVSYDVVSQRTDVLGLISAEDRPNAPCFLLERSLRIAGGIKDLSLGLIQTGKSSVTCSVDTKDSQISPRTAFKKIRFLRQTLTPDASVGEIKVPAAKSDAKEEYAIAEEDLDFKGQGVADSLSGVKRRGCYVSEGDMKQWICAARTMGMEKRVPRYRQVQGLPEGMEKSTATGFFCDSGQRSPDVWYRPTYEDLPIRRRFVASPDLRRGGRDSAHHIQRLGFRRPEEATPEYGAAISHSLWIPQGRGSSKIRGVSFGMTGREARASIKKRDEIRIPYRLNSGPLSQTICPHESNPILLHVSSFDLGRAASAHHAPHNPVPYHEPRVPLAVSYNITQPRISSCLAFKHQTPHRPITAHQFSCKEPEVVDAVYDAEFAQTSIVRARSLSPVNMDKSLGRPLWPAQVAPESAAGGLHGLDYWSGLGPCTEALADIRTRRLVDMEHMTGRK